ncbi:ArsR family transcriptional regulator [Micromonospora sp. CPCC 205556]|uniref:ArsR family transcriptional regulator n=1 Tax=Micromonospora sp. CPCC 205556 TaxID=3122398 RepID=UPI003FA60D65
MRALAHPARIAIMEHLSTREGGATACAEIVGLSPSATSYHLRASVKFGLVEQAPSRGGRAGAFVAHVPPELDGRRGARCGVGGARGRAGAGGGGSVRDTAWPACRWCWRSSRLWRGRFAAPVRPARRRTRRSTAAPRRRASPRAGRPRPTRCPTRRRPVRHGGRCGVGHSRAGPLSPDWPTGIPSGHG